MDEPVHHMLSVEFFWFADYRSVVLKDVFNESLGVKVGQERFGATFRRNWLFAVVRDIQVFSGRLLSESIDSLLLERFISDLPPPQNRLEGLVLRGLSDELVEHARSASAHLKRSNVFPHVRAAAAAREILEVEYAKNWSLKRLARDVNSNRNDLEKAFKQLTGMSVHQFLTERRIEIAKRQLVATSAGMKEIAQNVGYGAPSNFFKNFRRVTGLSPGQFRHAGPRRALGHS